MWKTVLRVFLVLLPVFVVGAAIYGWFAYRYWSDSPKLSRNYAAELNAPVLKFPAEQRAWPVYREAIIELSTDAPDAWRLVESVRDLVKNPELAAWLREHEHALAEFRRASKLPSLGHLLADQHTADDRRMQEASKRKSQREYEASRPPLQQPPPPPEPSENPLLMAVLLQPVGETARLVLAVQADAVLAADEGDAERMTDDLVALAAFADQLREIPLPVNDIRAAMRLGDALRSWGRLLETHPELFTVERLERLENAARKFADGRITARFDAERFNFYDVVQRCYSDDGDGSFRVVEAMNVTRGLRNSFEAGSWDLLLAPFSAPGFASRREVVQYFDDTVNLIEAQCAKPLWSADFRESDARLKNPADGRKYKLVELFAGSLKNIHPPLENAVQQRDAMLAVSAAHRYRRKHKKWPTTLEALVPEYLGEVPMDRFAGKPLKYLLVDDEPVFYSIGEDGKDDGGRPAEIRVDRPQYVGAPKLPPTEPWHWNIRTKKASYFIPDYVPDGDLILWPVAPARDPLDDVPPREEQP
jgi:hypothetical protein